MGLLIHMNGWLYDPAPSGGAGCAAANATYAISQGASIGNALKAAVIGGLVADVGGSIAGWAGAGTEGLTNYIVNGFVGGIISVAQGGKFGHGFAASFSSASLKELNFSEQWGWGTAENRVFHRTVTAAVVGGVVSKTIGGSYIVGAVSAAFSHYNNAEATNRKQQEARSLPSGTRRSARRRARASRGSSTMPALEPGFYGFVTDSLAVTFGVVSAEMGSIYIIDTAGRQVLRYDFLGAGPGAGAAGTASREFGALYLNGAGSVEGVSVVGEFDAALGFGATGSLGLPVHPLSPSSTSFSSGPSGGYGVGFGLIFSNTFFRRAYSFENAPNDIPTGE